MKSRKFTNIHLLLWSVVLAFIVYQYEPFHVWLLGLGDMGYVGAFIGGILFVSTFTVATGAVILLILAERLSAIEIGLIAGLGAVIGDLIIFRFVKDKLAAELTDIYNYFDGDHHFKELFHTKYFAWVFPVFGAIIIASPLPDELGVSLMGITKMKTYQFMIFSFILNAVGIFLVVSASQFIKP